MKQLIFSIALFFLSCNRAGYDVPENALDAAREFISARLEGDFKRASFYILPTENKESLVNHLQQQYQELPGEQKLQLHEASIIIEEDQALNDTFHIIYYNDSYTKKSRELKVVYTDNRWWAEPDM